MKYQVGVTGQALGTILTRYTLIQRFLIWLSDQKQNVCGCTQQQVEDYLDEIQEDGMTDKFFNSHISGLKNFFWFMVAHGHMKRIPFQPEFYQRKEIPQHHDRSVSPEVCEEVLGKLHLLPEHLRCMYLHLWCLGLRISEVCTLKGNAYYRQNQDTWLQVYQVKMKNYKRIPIAEGLYQIMQVYIRHRHIGPDGYLFTNRNGGPYRSATFRQQMKKFYVTFPNTNALRSQLTWTHYRLLLSVEDEQARRWYMDEAVASAWSSRQLERQISTMYYERLLVSREKELVQSEATELMAPLMAQNFIKDPYVLEFLDLKNYPALRESDLEQALLDKLQEFLLELGRGFCFVARQKLMRYEDDDFYLDLVFYHSILKCHVLIDLKIGKLTHGDIGQMDSYIRMFDALYKNVDDNPTIGIILCSQKNEAIVKYSVLNDAKQIFASKYRLELPTAEELQHELESERKRIEEQDE